MTTSSPRMTSPLTGKQTTSPQNTNLSQNLDFISAVECEEAFDYGPIMNHVSFKHRKMRNDFLEKFHHFRNESEDIGQVLTDDKDDVS